VVSASCSPLPVDHLGGAVLVVRAIDDDKDALAAGELRVGELRMDVARHQVYANGRIIRVTPIEFDLLRYLLAHAGRVVSRQELLEHVWRYQDGDDRDLVKSHIASLRHRLRDAGVSDARIENVYGVGYMLSSAGSPMALPGTAPTQGQAGDWW
jgi:DNA-binding response OmpR family regulator